MKNKRQTPLAIRLPNDLSRQIIKEKAEFLGLTTNCYLINLIKIDLKLVAISLILFFCSCSIENKRSEYKIIKIDNCEYIKSDCTANVLTHKSNCKNCLKNYKK